MSAKKEPAEANPGRRSLATTTRGERACKGGKEGGTHGSGAPRFICRRLTTGRDDHDFAAQGFRDDFTGRLVDHNVATLIGDGAQQFAALFIGSDHPGSLDAIKQGLDALASRASQEPCGMAGITVAGGYAHGSSLDASRLRHDRRRPDKPEHLVLCVIARVADGAQNRVRNCENEMASVLAQVEQHGRFESPHGPTADRMRLVVNDSHDPTRHEPVNGVTCRECDNTRQIAGPAVEWRRRGRLHTATEQAAHRTDEAADHDFTCLLSAATSCRSSCTSTSTCSSSSRSVASHSSSSISTLPAAAANSPKSESVASPVGIVGAKSFCRSTASATKSAMRSRDGGVYSGIAGPCGFGGPEPDRMLSSRALGKRYVVDGQTTIRQRHEHISEAELHGLVAVGELLKHLDAGPSLRCVVSACVRREREEEVFEGWHALNLPEGNRSVYTPG